MPGFLDNLMTGYANKVLGAPTASPADTASAYQNLMNSMNQNYKQQKQNFETNPDNQGKQWSAPSTEQRWTDQVNAMITSGNPALQKRGLDLLTAPKAAKDTRTDLQKQFEFLKGQGFQGTAGDLFNRIHPGRAVTNVNVSTGGQGVQGINFLSPAEKEQLNLPQDTPYYVDKNGQIKMAPGSSTRETQQQTNVTNTAINTADDIMFGKGGLYDTTESAVNKFGVPKALQRPAEAAYAFGQQFAQDDPRYAQVEGITKNLSSTIGRAYLGEKGVMTDEDVSRIKLLVPDPVKDSRATAQRKMKYIKKIVNTSDPTKAKKMVYGNTSAPADTAAPKPATSGPAKYTSKSGISFTVE